MGVTVSYERGTPVHGGPTRPEITDATLQHTLRVRNPDTAQDTTTKIRPQKYKQGYDAQVDTLEAS